MQAAIREALIGAVNTDYVLVYPGVPIVYDNAAFDRNNPPPMFAEFEIKFAGADQVGMSVQPRTRVHGFVYVTVWSRAGTGSKANLAMLDWFSAQLAYRTVSGIQLQASEPVGAMVPPAGWFMEQIKLYFYTSPT